MRPRKKTNLEPRLEACASMILHAPEKGTIRQAFPNPNAPLRLEIGCGKGAFVCALAAQHPEINFVAMERERNVAVIACERGMSATPPLPNVRFLLDDAKRLPELFLPAELDGIYINFCDPWHKRRQYKNRLTYRGNLAVYRTLLAPDAELRFKTDNYMLYHFSTFEFAETLPAYFRTSDLHTSEMAAGNLMTEYETYFSNLGQPIYAIFARKPSAPPID